MLLQRFWPIMHNSSPWYLFYPINSDYDLHLCTSGLHFTSVALIVTVSHTQKNWVVRLLRHFLVKFATAFGFLESLSVANTTLPPLARPLQKQKQKNTIANPTTRSLGFVVPSWQPNLHVQIHAHACAEMVHGLCTYILVLFLISYVLCLLFVSSTIIHSFVPIAVGI